MFPSESELTICFAHVAYQLQQRFVLRKLPIKSFGVTSREELEARVGEADVLVISGLWRNEFAERARKLHFIQSIGAGTDQFDRAVLDGRGIRLASAQGVNVNAVSEHAMSLILAMARRLPEARDNQAKHTWRGMISDLTQREDELGGKTLIIIGLGGIGGRLARLAKAFGMRVIGFKRNVATGSDGADSVHTLRELKALLPQADFVALTCPLTKETENVIDAEVLSRMKPSAYLVNAARGRCVEENALIAAMRAGKIAGAAIDVTVDEPLPASSPLWDMPNVFITPHTAGETRRYEDNVLDVLMDNLQRLWRGEATLRNQIL
ncbi:MAG TPA: D-2-hydroxyacid dehydrogenase [Pseudolabrys sp.]|nr:D-2-hydroxyacid dehydrogenase [Pseudolabrys sp.]